MSGGADSTAMALLAASAGRSIEIHHVHHGLHDAAEEHAQRVDALADHLDAHLVVHRVEVAAGPDLEARARSARYAALPDRVCVAHTADDRAETVLLNLFRGAGPTGVAAGFDRVTRPLLDLRRTETAAVCAAHGIVPVDDPMNHDPAFTRVQVRQQLLPLAAEIFGRDPVPLLVRHADLVADLLAPISDAAAVVDPTDTSALRDLPRAVAAEAVRTWLRDGADERHPVDAASVERVLAVAAGDVVATEVSGGRRVARRAGVLRVEPGGPRG